MRILVWNIKFFSLSTIDEAADDPRQMKTPRSAWRNHHILQTIEAGDPDVFIIIENRSSPGQLGSLAQGNGAAGALRMLHFLRLQDDRLGRHSQWSLVPPLRLVGVDAVDRPRQYTEVISVFYKHRALDFQGPFLWPRDNPARGSKVAIPPTPAHAPAGAYPAPWDHALPAGNHFAGQFCFWDGAGRPLDFGGAAQRNPFLTKFVERAGARRTVNIVTSHPRPVLRDAISAAAQLGSIGNIANPPAGTVNVLCGDFNIDISDRRDNQFGGTGYEVLGWDGYQVLVQPSAGPTLVKNVPEAMTDAYFQRHSLDNVLIRYGAPPRAAPSATIVDMVAGAPGYASDMATPLGAMPSNDVFRYLENYGHIGYLDGTSDHLAISADI